MGERKFNGLFLFASGPAVGENKSNINKRSGGRVIAFGIKSTDYRLLREANKLFPKQANLSISSSYL